jgi:MFS family permease
LRSSRRFIGEQIRRGGAQKLRAMHLRRHRIRPHNPMPESRYEVLALFTSALVGASLWIMATGALMTFFASALHLGQTQLGLILSIQIMGSVAMTSVAGLLTDRFGDKKVVFWSGALMGLALLVASLVANYTWLIVWLLVYGIGYAASTPAGSHAVIFFFKKSERGIAMGVRQCGVPLAGFIGALLLPAVAMRLDYRAALATAGVLTLLGTSVASLFYREPVELQGERASLRALIADMVAIARESRLILLTLVSMVLCYGQYAMVAFLTLTFVRRAGFAPPIAVALFTLSQAAAVAGRLAWGWASDRIFGGDRTVPLAVVCVLTALAGFAMANVGGDTPFWFAALVATSLGFTAEGWFGVSVTGYAEIGGEEHSGSALGVGQTWVMLAGFVAPTIFGALAQVYGLEFAWRSLACLQLLGIVPALLASPAIARVLRRERAT